jgi:hypothetical protein
MGEILRRGGKGGERIVGRRRQFSEKMPGTKT